MNNIANHSVLDWITESEVKSISIKDVTVLETKDFVFQIALVANISIAETHFSVNTLSVNNHQLSKVVEKRIEFTSDQSKIFIAFLWKSK